MLAIGAIENVGERQKRIEIANKLFFIGFEDCVQLTVKILNSMAIGSTLPWFEPISIAVSFGAVVVASH
jgi:hypothetical protein